MFIPGFRGARSPWWEGWLLAIFFLCLLVGAGALVFGGIYGVYWAFTHLSIRIA